MYYYTAIIRDSDHKIEFAEHFEDKAECQKRSIQLNQEAHQRGEVDPWKSWEGEEPPEVFIARLKAKEGDDVEALVTKAALKSVSVLTAPELDDSKECRPVPSLSLALSAVEAAQQSVLDGEQGISAIMRRLEGVELGIKAAAMRTELDMAEARLYHAQQDLLDKLAAVEGLRNA